jgi:hypothetical protein
VNGGQFIHVQRARILHNKQAAQQRRVIYRIGAFRRVLFKSRAIELKAASVKYVVLKRVVAN